MQLDDIDLYDPDSYVDGRAPRDVRHPAPRGAGVLARQARRRRASGASPATPTSCTVNRDAVAVLLVGADGAHGGAAAPRRLEMSRLMMLNMDPPQHTQLRKIVNRGLHPQAHPRAHGRARASGPPDIVDEIIEKGSCDFVSEVAAELPLQAIAEFLGVPQEDRRMIFDWSNQLIGFDDPEFRTSEEQAQEAAGAALRLRRGPGRRAAGQPARRHRHRPHHRRGRRRGAHHQRVRPLLPAARGGRQRDHPQRHLPRDARPHRAPRAAAAPARRPDAHRHGRRGDPALGHAGHALPAHRHPRHRAPRPGDQGRRGRDHVAHVGQPRRGRVRRPLRLRRRAASTTPTRCTWPSAAAARTSASAPTWPAPR